MATAQDKLNNGSITLTKDFLTNEINSKTLKITYTEKGQTVDVTAEDIELMIDLIPNKMIGISYSVEELNDKCFSFGLRFLIIEQMEENKNKKSNKKNDDKNDEKTVSIFDIIDDEESINHDEYIKREEKEEEESKEDIKKNLEDIRAQYGKHENIGNGLISTESFDFEEFFKKMMDKDEREKTQKSLRYYEQLLQEEREDYAKLEIPTINYSLFGYLNKKTEPFVTTVDKKFINERVKNTEYLYEVLRDDEVHHPYFDVDYNDENEEIVIENINDVKLKIKIASNENIHNNIKTFINSEFGKCYILGYTNNKDLQKELNNEYSCVYLSHHESNDEEKVKYLSYRVIYYNSLITRAEMLKFTRAQKNFVLSQCFYDPAVYKNANSQQMIRVMFSPKTTLIGKDGKGKNIYLKAMKKVLKKDERKIKDDEDFDFRNCFVQITSLTPDNINEVKFDDFINEDIYKGKTSVITKKEKDYETKIINKHYDYKECPTDFKEIISAIANLKINDYNDWVALMVSIRYYNIDEETKLTITKELNLKRIGSNGKINEQNNYEHFINFFNEHDIQGCNNDKLYDWMEKHGLHVTRKKEHYTFDNFMYQVENKEFTMIEIIKLIKNTFTYVSEHNLWYCVETTSLKNGNGVRYHYQGRSLKQLINKLNNYVDYVKIIINEDKENDDDDAYSVKILKMKILPLLKKYRSLKTMVAMHSDNKSTFSLFSGYQQQAYKKYNTKILEPFWELLDLITGDGDKKQKKLNRSYVRNWLRNLFRNLNDNGRTAFIFASSNHGLGKNLFFNVLCDLFGINYAIQSTKLQYLTQSFNSRLVGKKLIVVNEVDNSSQKSSQSVVETIKEMITEDMIDVQYKGIEIIPVCNYAGFVFLSNDKMPIMIDSKNRRFTYFYSTANVKSPAEYSAMYKLFNEQKFMSNLLGYLLYSDYEQIDTPEHGYITGDKLKDANECKNFSNKPLHTKQEKYAIEEADPFTMHKNTLRGFVKKVLIDNELLQNKEYIFPFADIMDELRERKLYMNDARETGRFKQSLIGYKFNFTYEQEKYKINVVDVGRMYYEGNRTTCVKIQIIYIGI